MTFSVESELVEPLVRGLLGAVDVDGGPTEEQRLVLTALVTHLWGRDDLVDAVALDPAGTAAALRGAEARRRFHEVVVALEVCRHPLSAAQVHRVEEYAAALHVEGPDLPMLRDLVESGRTRAAADFQRFMDDNLAARVEPSLRGLPLSPDAPEPELEARLLALHDLDEGTLGRAFLDFYRRNRLPLPGAEGSDMNHFFVGHDMTHVIAGIEPTGPGEVALSAFQLAIDDNPVNSSALLASLVVHEAGFGHPSSVAAETGILSDPVAADLLGAELERGSGCASDFSLVDHFELAPLPLAEVREHFGVAPPEAPADGHHCW